MAPSESPSQGAPALHVAAERRPWGEDAPALQALLSPLQQNWMLLCLFRLDSPGLCNISVGVDICSGTGFRNAEVRGCASQARCFSGF